MHNESKAIKLYDDQVLAVEKLRENFRAQIKRQVLCSATGSGKSVMGAALMEEAAKKGNRSLFIVDRIALVNQTSAVLERYGINHGVIQGNHWRWRIEQKIQVASAQTLESRGFPDDVDLIINDECHTTRKKVIEWIKASDKYTVGLSATPMTKGLGKTYDTVVSITTTNKLIDAGRLCKYKVLRAKEVDMKGVKVVSGEWDREETAKRVIPIVGDIVTEYIKKGDNEKFILFASSIVDCEEFHRQFNAAGIQTALVTYV
jgi:superfamily II DNA or RNA helicase